MATSRGVPEQRLNRLYAVAATILSGAANLLIQLVVAAFVSAAAFGIFAIAATTAVFILGFTRTVLGQTDQLRGESGRDVGAINASYAAGAACLVLAAPTILLGVLTGHDVTGAIGGGLLLGGVLTVRDCMRYRGFRMELPVQALISDVVALVVTVVGLVVLRGQMTTWLAIVVWTAATVLGMLPGIRPLRYLPARASPITWVRRHFDLIGPASGEYLIQSSLPFLLNFAILAVGGPSALGGYRLIQLVFAALGNFAVGMNTAGIPGILTTDSALRLRRTTRQEITTSTAISIGFVAAILIVPVGYGVAVFGDSWTNMLAFTVVGAVHGWANACTVPVYTGLRLVDRARFSFIVRVVVGALNAVAALVGLAVGSVGIIVWSLAVAAIAGAAIRLIGLERRLNDYR